MRKGIIDHAAVAEQVNRDHFNNLAYFLADTQRISFDIVVKTMYETGISMNQRFRETAEGSLAKMFNSRRR